MSAWPKKKNAYQHINIDTLPIVDARYNSGFNDANDECRKAAIAMLEGLKFNEFNSYAFSEKHRKDREKLNRKIDNLVKDIKEMI
jgi:hypothetical protein